MSESPTPIGRLTDEDLEEFIAIYKKEFGEDISRDEARHMASQLMELYALLARAPRKAGPPPDPKFERKPESSNSEG